jgi:hypothetical protein
MKTDISFAKKLTNTVKNYLKLYVVNALCVLTH